MGSAMAAGLGNKGYEIVVSDIKRDRMKLAEDEYGFPSIPEKPLLVGSTDITVIAVKPQELDDLFDEIGDAAENKRLISVIAGRRMIDFITALRPSCLSRFMPNLAATVASAAVGVAFSKDAPPDFRDDSLDIAGAIGRAYEIPERLMPAITGLSGSGIAFVFAFFHAMALGGVSAGVPYPKSLDISLTAIEGALKVIRKSGENPGEWINRVISPAGTTIAGIKALEEKGFTAAVMEAVAQASQRAEELEG